MSNTEAAPRAAAPGSKRLPGRHPLPRRAAHRHRALLRLLRPAYVRHHRGVPPVLLAPHVQDVAPVPVLDGAPRDDGDAEGAALVERDSSPSPPRERPAGGRALAGAARVLAFAHRLDREERL